jgi:hypothetical protein
MMPWLATGGRYHPGMGRRGWIWGDVVIGIGGKNIDHGYDFATTVAEAMVVRKAKTDRFHG